MAAFTTIAAGIGLAASAGQVAGGLFGKKKAARAHQRKIDRIQGKIDTFDYKNEIVNPYENFTNTAEGLVTNTAEDLQNPFEDLRVNTQAAELQSEKVAQNQANILDQLVQGGGNAGALATALAAQSTQAQADVSAQLAEQEQANQRLKAQGEQQRQMAFAEGEARRQNMFMQGANRYQEAMARGKEFVFNAKENRAATRLEGLYQQLGGAQSAKAAEANRRSQMISSGLSGMASIGAAAMGSDSGSGKDNPLGENYRAYKAQGGTQSRRFYRSYNNMG